MNRAKANSLTRKMQVVAIAFAVVAGVVAAGVIPMSAPSGAVTVAPPPVVPVKPVEAPMEVNAPALATAIDLIAPPVIPREKVDLPPPPPPPSAWKYLGAIISGSYKRAVVLVNDKQQLVAEGTKVGPSETAQTEVLEIDPGFIRIKDPAGAEQTIELEARQKTQLLIAAPAPAGAPRSAPSTVVPLGAVQTSMRGAKGLSPDVSDQIAKAVMELRGLRDITEEERRDKLRSMFPNENFDAEAAFKGDTKGVSGKGGGGKGGK